MPVMKKKMENTVHEGEKICNNTEADCNAEAENNMTFRPNLW